MDYIIRHGHLIAWFGCCIIAYISYKTDMPALGLFLLSAWGLQVADMLDESPPTQGKDK